VKLAARSESLTVGPQVLLSQQIVQRVPTIARVGPPNVVTVKGIAEPGVVFELRGLVGEDAIPSERMPSTPVDLVAADSRVEAKRA
jgi:class 3 adenylate cyclase